MIVEDYMNVLGRGWLIIAYSEKLSRADIHCGDMIVRGDKTFTVEGIDRLKYGWWMNRVGLVLSPNRLVPDCFELGDEIEILKKEE